MLRELQVIKFTRGIPTENLYISHSEPPFTLFEIKTLLKLFMQRFGYSLLICFDLLTVKKMQGKRIK